MEYRAIHSAAPHQNLQSIIAKLQLTEQELAVLRSCRDVFVSKKDEFAVFFHDSFLDMRETHIILERFGKPDVMKRTWAAWFERLFSNSLDKDFISYMWRVGLRHVEINLDQRFSNLGFSFVRQFCRRIAAENFRPEIVLEILPVVDKLVDFCILVETSAYIGTTVRCDVEILKGISDKIRNPVTIIGGNLRRLQRHIDPKIPLYEDYEFLISSTRHCEEMIEDIAAYIDTFEREARIERCMIETIIENMLEKLSARKKAEGIKVNISISPDSRFVQGDPTDLRHVIYHTLENALDAARSAKDPSVRITCEPNEHPAHTVRVEVVNNGEVINTGNISNILSPFYSTKAGGSGLGLSIVNLALRKNFGEIDFEPIPQEGTKVTVILQRAE